MGDGSAVRRTAHERLAQERRLKAVAEWRDISQAEVAAAIGESQTNYNRYEKGRIKIPNEVIGKAAGYFGVRKEYLWSGDEPRRVEPTATVEVVAGPAPRRSRAVESPIKRQKGAR